MLSNHKPASLTTIAGWCLAAWIPALLVNASVGLALVSDAQQNGGSNEAWARLSVWLFGRMLEYPAYVLVITIIAHLSSVREQPQVQRVLRLLIPGILIGLLAAQTFVRLATPS